MEGELEQALAGVLGAAPKLTVAGRTDAGVHAWGQVASFCSQREVEPERLAASLNGLLGPEVAVAAAERAPEGFDARRDARSRTYCYRVVSRPSPSPFERGRALWVRWRPDPALLGGCADLLAGRHDFTAFTPTETDHVRFERDVTRAKWRADGQVLELWIEADAFMRHMVRILVGTMLEVAAGRMTIERFAWLLEGAPRGEAGPTAPPHGLYLASVSY